MSDVVIGALTAADVAAIKQVTQRFVDSILAGNFAIASRLYTTDATLMPPHHPIASGRGAIQAWMESLPKVTRFTFEVDAVDGRADLAYARGRFVMRMQTPDGDIEDKGKFLEIRRRQPDGSWLIEADMFNSDLS